MPFSDRAVFKVKKFFLVLSCGPPCGFNPHNLFLGSESPRPSHCSSPDAMFFCFCFEYLFILSFTWLHRVLVTARGIFVVA